MKHIGDDLVKRLIEAARAQDVEAERLFALAADCIVLGKDHERGSMARMDTVAAAVKLTHGCFQDPHGDVIGVAIDLALAGRSAWRAQFEPTTVLPAAGGSAWRE